MHSTTVLIKFTFCKLGKKEYMYHVIGLLPVPDPDLEIRVGGGVRGAVIETLREGRGGGLQKQFFGPSVWAGPSPVFATDYVVHMFHLNSGTKP